MKPYRVLFYDLETAPLLAHIWRPDDDYIPHERILHDSFLLCWGSKWRGGGPVTNGALTGRQARRQDDRGIVKALADQVRQADIVVAHNIKRFDLPMLNNRLLLLDLEPIGPVKVIDTLTLAQRNFRLASNRLDYLARVLGLGSKIKTDFGLWRQCYLGDETALARLARYNRRDVVLLSQVFERLLPYVNNLPRLVETDGEMACPYCGKSKLVARGYHRTQVSTFRKVQCVFCQRYSRYRLQDADIPRPVLAPL